MTDTMNLDEIKQILELVREHELTEFELEQGGVKIRIQKQSAQTTIISGNPGAAVNTPPVAAPTTERLPAAGGAPLTSTPAEAAAGEELAIITSPIVGTFYRSAAPGAPSFADVGDVVRKGQVLCVIEAMKLMNEITSEHEGELVEVFIDNGQPVQYGERLFAIRQV
ncbi:MAG: acetyl-CoA carboxylase biotin carboxyl carrier protein [Luteitalea sp.]|nr:acetyl-CoA carboxylase biotin carboxyl carrier protein [Luteitalea sp.]